MTDLDRKLARAWEVRWAQFPPEISWSYPLDTAVLSLTGSACALDCAHCGGHYLRGMRPIWDAAPDASTSCLISGGCDPQGRVPVLAHLERVRAWRTLPPCPPASGLPSCADRRLAGVGGGRKMNWHVGLISEAEMAAIAPLVDVISFDMIGDDETIREVYGLDRTAEDYLATYRMLRRHARVVPHVTIGLQGGALGHERPAFQRLRELGVDGLVLLVLVPTAGTRYAGRRPPPVESAAEILVEARLLFPDVPLYLGCMRPRGAYRDALDELAVRAGVNAIVSPSRRARQVASELGLTGRTMRECCVLDDR